MYMARVTPTIANIADKTKWEFYAYALFFHRPPSETGLTPHPPWPLLLQRRAWQGREVGDW
eukprot:SAG11_NODE_787_length_7169_cov_4.571146_6_plen_61_part_00